MKSNGENEVSQNENNQRDEIAENSAESSVVFYGDSLEADILRFKDYNDIKNNNLKKQKMEGFSEDYIDIVDYILKITHRIWEEKGIGIIYDTYSNNIVMHFCSYNACGINEVISGTLQTLHAFPDRRLIGQDVIWSSFNKHGFFSSHRIMSTATNLGDSSFGPATGKKLSFRTVADCAIEANRIYEEWLVRDNLWIVKQLGYDPHDVAKKMAQYAQNKTSSLQQYFGISEAMDGQMSPKIYTAKDNSVGEFVLEMISKIYNYKLFNEVTKYYNENSVVHYICDKDLTGYDEIQGMFISLFASFPNACFIVERVTCNERDKKDEWNVAVRWRIKGLHEGIGYFGAPTGKPINILGITHYHILNKKIIEEWITFDGLDVLRQIYLNLPESFEKDPSINE